MPETARSGGPGPANTDQSATPARDFTLRSAFALSFSDISPIVGIYSVFAIGLIAAGPAFFWAFPVVLIGQMLVTGVFGDLVPSGRSRAASTPGRGSWSARATAGSPGGRTCGA